MDFLRPYSVQILGLLRLMTGLMLLEHGTSKFLGFPASSMTGVSPTSLIGIAGILELVGGALLAVGLFTRPVAFVLSGMCAVGYFYAHFPQGFFPMLNNGEAAVLYCFILLYLAAAGGGAWSLDRSMRRAD